MPLGRSGVGVIWFGFGEVELVGAALPVGLTGAGGGAAGLAPLV